VLDLGEQRLHERRDHYRQAASRGPIEADTGSRMPIDLNSQRPQLLNQTPDLGSPSANFFPDLGAAHHDHRMIHEHAHDTSQTHVGFLRRGNRALRGAFADWSDLADEGIITIAGQGSWEAPR
jgi:hypothetical protein